MNACSRQSVKGMAGRKGRKGKVSTVTENLSKLNSKYMYDMRKPTITYIRTLTQMSHIAEAQKATSDLIIKCIAMAANTEQCTKKWVKMCSVTLLSASRKKMSVSTIVVDAPR